MGRSPAAGRSPPPEMIVLVDGGDVVGRGDDLRRLAGDLVSDL
jgi:hypothetical protein